MLSTERKKVTCLGTEAKGNRKFEKEADMEVAEIRLLCLQGQNLATAPFIQAIFGITGLDNAEENLGHEQ